MDKEEKKLEPEQSKVTVKPTPVESEELTDEEAAKIAGGTMINSTISIRKPCVTYK